MKMSKPSSSSIEFSNQNLSHFDSISNCNEKGNVHFLKPLNQVPKDIQNKESIKSENTIDGHLIDIQIMNATELSKKYSQSYSSWKNMKQRCKKGYILSPLFDKFASFLKAMGPSPSKNFTLDRIDNNNNNYSPDNCRWADKYTQNQNKGNNVYLTHKGEKFTISVWAAKTNQKADTLYHRKYQGWTDAEIITGKKTSVSLMNSLWPEGDEKSLEAIFKDSGQECRVKFLLEVLLKRRMSLLNYIERVCDPNDEDNPQRILPANLNEMLNSFNRGIQKTTVALGKKHGLVITNYHRIYPIYSWEEFNSN